MCSSAQDSSNDDHESRSYKRELASVAIAYQTNGDLAKDGAWHKVSSMLYLSTVCTFTHTDE